MHSSNLIHGRKRNNIFIPKYLNYNMDYHKFKDLMRITFTTKLSTLPPTYFILDIKR